MIFFLHIHKTGGQTLGTRLASAFSLEESHLLSTDFRFPQDVARFKEIIKKKQFAESHVFGPILQEARECEFVVAVRSPIDHLISLIRHMRREVDHFGHRPANVLAPAVFIDTLEDHLTDYQASRILSAFFDLNYEINRLGRTRAFIENLYRIIDKVRWLVPTESIDEFTDLWSMEMGRPTFAPKGDINIAPPDNFDQRAYRELLLARPQLYSVDALVHRIAVERFEDYRRRVIDSKLPWPQTSGSRLAFSSGGSSVWLSTNWYDPEKANGNIIWWFGPKTGGEIRLRRSDVDKFLCFDVVTVNGISHDDIQCIRKDGFAEIKAIRLKRSDDLTSYCIPLDGLSGDDSLILIVPRCIAPIARSLKENGILPQAFAATRFKLAAEPVNA